MSSCSFVSLQKIHGELLICSASAFKSKFLSKLTDMPVFKHMGTSPTSKLLERFKVSKHGKQHSSDGIDPESLFDPEEEPCTLKGEYRT